MEMTAFQVHVAMVRGDDAIIRLPDRAQRGAAAYLDAYAYVAERYPNAPRWRLRRLAAQRLAWIASPPLSKEQQKAARLARQRLKRLSR